jgi:hypothetical protein
VVAANSGTFTIYPLENGDANLKVLKIPKSDTSESYYVSYRQPIGFDSNFGPNYSFVNGVSIHTWNGSAATQTQLIGAGNTLYANSAPLLDNPPCCAQNAVFKDDINNVTITQVSHSTSSVTITVTSGAGGNISCARANPTISISPLSQTAGAGKTLSYTVSIKNNDANKCPSSVFNLSAVFPSGWSQTLSPTTLSLSPGGTGSAIFALTSTPTELDGSYPFSVSAVNSSAPTYSASAGGTYVVFTDTVAPTVAITSPANGSTVSGRVTIAVSASDNVKVAKVEIYIDNVLQTTLAGNTTGSYTYIWSTTKVASGPHIITAWAYDGAGNNNLQTISVTVK